MPATVASPDAAGLLARGLGMSDFADLGEGRYCEELEARPERWVNGVLFNEYPYVGVRA
jgi:hypothetical protein